MSKATGKTPVVGSNKNLIGSGKIPKQSAKDRISPTELQQLRQTFDLFDQDNGGTIDPVQIQSVLEQLGLDRRNPIVNQMINDLKDQNKPLNFDEFVEIIVGRLGDVKSRQGLGKLFKLYDTDGSGFIDFEKIKAIGKQLGQTLNDDEILEMMHHVHILNKTESNEYFNFEDFYKVVTKRKY